MQIQLIYISLANRLFDKHLILIKFDKIDSYHISIMSAKRNRQIENIGDPVKKRNAKCKRSKMIMRKAHELSVLCELNVNV